MKFLRSFFVVQILLSFIFLSYSQLLHAAAGWAEDTAEHDSYSERARILKHAQLLGQLSAWADHNPEYRGPKVPGSPKETMKPDEIYSSMLRQLVYEGGIMADDMAVIFSNMRFEAEKGYGKSRELAEVLIKERGVESLVPSFSRQAESLQGLVLRTSLLNPPPTEGHSARLFERARIFLEPLMEEHQRLYETAERVAAEGIDAIKDDPDLGRFYGMPELWEGNTVMMMPVVAWAAHHIARSYEGMFTGLHHVMAGKRSAADFLSSGRGMETYHVTTAFPEFKEGNTAIEDFLAVIIQLTKIDNEMLVAETMNTPIVVKVSERQVASYERHRDRGHEAFRLPDYAPPAASKPVKDKASKPKKVPRKPGKKKRKKKQGAGSAAAAPSEYAEHKVMLWLKQLESDFIKETDRLLAVARTTLEEESGSAPRSAATAEERAAISALRERVEAEEESLAAEAVAMEEAERKRVIAAEALLEKQRIAEERRQQREEQKRKDAEEAKARAEERRAVKEERKALARLEAEERDAEVEAQRQEEESRRQAEEEARELAKLEEQRRISELNSIAARKRIERRQRKTEEYRSKLAEEEAKMTVEAAATAAAVGATLTEVLERTEDRDYFSAIFALTPVDYDTVLALLSRLRGVEIEGIDSQKPKVFFDLPDGRKKMLLFHKPHHDGNSLHRRSQNLLRWVLGEMGYTKGHFGIE